MGGTGDFHLRFFVLSCVLGAESKRALNDS